MTQTPVCRVCLAAASDVEGFVCGRLLKACPKAYNSEGITNESAGAIILVVAARGHGKLTCLKAYNAEAH